LFTNTGSASNNNISPEVQKDKLYSASWPSNIHSKINIGYPVPSRENALLKQITGDVAVDRTSNGIAMAKQFSMNSMNNLEKRSNLNNIQDYVMEKIGHNSPFQRNMDSTARSLDNFSFSRGIPPVPKGLLNPSVPRTVPHVPKGLLNPSVPRTVSHVPKGLFNPSVPRTVPHVPKGLLNRNKVFYNKPDMNRQKPDNLLYMLALAGGMEGLSQNPLLMSQLLRQGGGSQSNMLRILALASGGEGLMQNPLLLSHLMGNNKDSHNLLQTLALTGGLEGMNPLMLYHLTQSPQGQRSSSELLRLLAVSGGGENMNPLLLHTLLSRPNHQSSGIRSPTGTSRIRPSTDILPLLALSGGGENMNPLLLQRIMSQSNQNQNGPNLLHLMALAGGEESPLMQNPALMYRMMQSNRQSKRGNSMSMLFPLLMASGSEAMSENPMLMMSMLRGSNRQTY
jgi:hypothetical protein